MIELHLLQISANCSDTYYSLSALLLTRTACKSTTLFFVICLFVCFFLQPVKSIIHALGHNRARQRDKLAHLLEEFAALQDEVGHLIYFVS